MFMFNVTIDHQKITLGCDTFANITEGPFANNLQLIGVKNMEDDQFPEYEVDVLFLPFTCLNWFAKLRSKEVEEIEEAEEVKSTVAQAKAKGKGKVQTVANLDEETARLRKKEEDLKKGSVYKEMESKTQSKKSTVKTTKDKKK